MIQIPLKNGDTMWSVYKNPKSPHDLRIFENCICLSFFLYENKKRLPRSFHLSFKNNKVNLYERCIGDVYHPRDTHKLVHLRFFQNINTDINKFEKFIYVMSRTLFDYAKAKGTCNGVYKFIYEKLIEKGYQPARPNFTIKHAITIMLQSIWYPALKPIYENYSIIPIVPSSLHQGFKDQTDIQKVKKKLIRLDKKDEEENAKKNMKCKINREAEFNNFMKNLLNYKVINL